MEKRILIRRLPNALLKLPKEVALDTIDGSWTLEHVDPVEGEKEGTVQFRHDDSRWLSVEKDYSDAGRYFIACDVGSQIDIYPVGDVYTLVPQVRSKQSTDEAESNSRQMIDRERQRAALIARHSDDIPTADDSPFGEDLGVDRQKKKKLKGILKERQKGTRIAEFEETSALAVGDVVRAEVDWDFDGDGLATDDEEAPDPMDDEDVVNPIEDDDDTRLLTGYGMKVTELLETQKITEADEEVQAYENDEGDSSSAADRPSAVSVSQSKSYESAKTRIIMQLNKSPEHTMQLRNLLVALGLTKAGSEPFHVAQKAIKELCDVNKASRTVTLKYEYRNV